MLHPRVLPPVMAKITVVTFLLVALILLIVQIFGQKIETHESCACSPEIQDVEL